MSPTTTLSSLRIGMDPLRRRALATRSEEHTSEHQSPDRLYTTLFRASSTYDDLRAEREQVLRAVLEMGHIPVGMEMFSAADEEQWKIIARHIDESDYYIVIVAHRYGSITPEGISY